MNKYLSFFNSPYSISDYFVVPLRIITGFYFIIHGIGLFNSESINGFANFFGSTYHAPFPVLMAYLKFGSEFFGGIMLILGLFTRLAALLILITMTVATLTVHVAEILSKGELAFIYAIIMITILMAGPGKLSVDHVLNSKVKQN